MREIRTSGSEGRGWKRTYGSRTEQHRESEWTYAPDPKGVAPPPDPTNVMYGLRSASREAHPRPPLLLQPVRHQAVLAVRLPGA